MKLWGGRFQKETDRLVNDFNSSIMFDSKMYKEDIEGSIAHAEMLGRQGIISKEEAASIIKGLSTILVDLRVNKVELSADNEDIHMNVEQLLTKRIGESGKRLHTARSRNDQVALDLRMYLKKEVKVIIKHILTFQSSLIKKAKMHTETVMPGYTHLQRAQPITFAHHLMAYAEMLKRDVTRLEDAYVRLDIMPLGSGALAGTTYPIDRDFVAGKLDFAKITRNSLDAVSDRDFVIEICSALAIIMMHLSRFAEEIILWCSWEFRFVDLDDAYSTGSSIMPQKKNPDVAELVRGKAGRVYGDLMALLTVMKGLPLAYNKDMQEDKEPIFDALETVSLCISVFTKMFDTLSIKPENMIKAASGGFINATDCADYLVRKGLAFRDAYMIVGRLVTLCINMNTDMESLSLEDFKSVCDVFSEDVYDAISLKSCIKSRNVPGGPSPEAVMNHIDYIETFIKEREDS